jgi:malate synthase
VVTRELVRRILDEEVGKIRAAVGEATYARGHHDAARDVFEAVALGEPFVEFLTLPASERIDL